MLSHPHAGGFKAASKKEIEQVLKMGVFLMVSLDDQENHELIPLMWVFTYKFDTDGFLYKYKARLVVRGDLQTTKDETYAATLAARTFRALMAIAALFDMEIYQWDAINAFLNARLKDKVYCSPPPGFEHLGNQLQLLRALYGLKQAPNLWYNEFKKALEDMGFHEVPGVNCLYTNDKLIVFFYVDDIVALCMKQNIPELKEFEQRLTRRFEMRSMGELRWFLGIRIERDRSSRKIWLCQDSFIAKICNRFGITPSDRFPETPLPDEVIRPSEEEPELGRSRIYQQMVGSLAYLALIGRPDIAHDHSTMSRFLSNPSTRHVELVRRMLHYLLGTMYHAIELSSANTNAEAWLEEPEFYGASDAAFGDDPATRKSSQGYIFKLFGGTIDWKANLQRSVTRSTTEAELLSLSTAGAELQWWKRLFKGIMLDTQVEPTLYCDNLQTVNLMKKEAPKLDTKLRHVDVHQHWLRQEVQEKRINVQWIRTDLMPADGLTKHLPKQKHRRFMKQLGLVDIRKRIQGF